MREVKVSLERVFHSQDPGLSAGEKKKKWFRSLCRQEGKFKQTTNKIVTNEKVYQGYDK